MITSRNPVSPVKTMVVACDNSARDYLINIFGHVFVHRGLVRGPVYYYSESHELIFGATKEAL